MGWLMAWEWRKAKTTAKANAEDAESAALRGRNEGLAAEVGVFFIDPVLAGWCEEVEVDAVFESLGHVRDVAGDDEKVAGVEKVFGRGSGFAEGEAHEAGGDVGDLFVEVEVQRDDAALF